MLLEIQLQLIIAEILLVVKVTLESLKLHNFCDFELFL